MTTGVIFWACTGVVVYTLAGYPLLLSALARLRPKSISYGAPLPSISMIIAAHNESDVIEQKLVSTLALSYPSSLLQVIVATDGSDDDTVAIVNGFRHRGVTLSHHRDRGGKAAALNRAVQAASGEIIVFSDANNRFEDDALLRLVEPFADKRVGMASGAKLIAGGPEALEASEGWYWRYESLLKEQESRLSSCVAVAGEILAMRRQLFEPMPPGLINDDFYQAMNVIKHGKRVVYTPGARSWEATSASQHDEMERRARIVAGRYQALHLARQLLPLRHPLILWQVISHKFLRPVVPLAMSGAFIAGISSVVRPTRSRRRRLLHLASPFNWLLAAAQLLFYGTSVLGQRMEHKKGPWKVIYVSSFFFNSNRAALVGLARWVFRHQSDAWRRVERHVVPKQVEVILAPLPPASEARTSEN